MAIEGRAARANKTVSEFVRDSLSAPLPEPRGLNAVERHDLSRIALHLKQFGEASQILAELQSLIRRIDDHLDPPK